MPCRTESRRNLALVLSCILDKTDDDACSRARESVSPLSKATSARAFSCQKRAAAAAASDKHIILFSFQSSPNRRNMCATSTFVSRRLRFEGHWGFQNK